MSTNSDADSMAYSSNASEGSDGVFMTAFDRCPPTFSDDILDREDIFPTPSADYVAGCAKSTTWETDHELAVLEDMSNEWTMFSDPSFENRNNLHPRDVSKNMGAMQRDDENDYENDHYHRERIENSGHGGVTKGKNARLVSPDRNVLPATVATTLTSNDGVATPDDDLSAWGFTSTAVAANTTTENGDSPATKQPTTTPKSNDLQDAFGSNFFGRGFDDDDDDDGFFGHSDWTSPKSSTSDKNSGAIGGKVEANNDPWGRINYDVNPFEEKKDEDTGSVVFTNVTLPDPITPTTEPTFSHPLKQKQPQGKAKNEVVVSFEGYKHEILRSPSNSSFSPRPNGELNLSSEKGSRPPVTAKSHRRINSNGSQASRKGHRRINSNGSQRRGGGGSVGSNSSAVDQILEHYRQKRLAKQNGKSSATSSTVSSSNHRSIPSMDSLSSVPSSDMAAAVATSAAAALSIMDGRKNSPLNDTMTSSLSSSSRRVSSPQSSPPLPRNQSNNGVVDWPDDSGVYSPAAAPPLPSRNVHKTARADNVADQFLMANIEATIGPRGSAPDIESLSGRSFNRSPRLRNRQASDSQSIDSRTSRNSRYSFRTYESNRSSIKGVNSMSPESKSVANDLFRLEAQLAEVARQQELQDDEPVSSRREVIFVNDNSLDKKNSSSDMSNNNGCIGAEPIPRQNPITVVAPPGKLGILLLNNKIGGVPSTPTYVSAVRSESVLAGKVRVGDQLMKIDGEDVSQCNSKQIMAIMATKSEFERVLEFMCLQSSNESQEWI